MGNQDHFDVNKIEYLDIKDITFNYSNPILLSSIERSSIDYELDIEKNISEQDKSIILIFKIQLKTFDSKKREIIGTYASAHLFRVENIEHLVKQTKGSFEVDDLLDDTVTGMAYSTFRGLAHQKFAGTPFSNFILPITRPEDLEKSAKG